MLSEAGFNAFGIATTKYSSATHRSVLSTSRTVIIRVISTIFLGELFQPWAIPGLIMIVIGTAMYNEILVIPCLGLDQNTKKAIAKRKQLVDMGEDEPMI